MIVGIGCDIVEHHLTEILGWENDTNTLARVFSKQELDLYDISKNIRFICGRFAVKEAVLKCLGTAMHDGISLTDITVAQSENGKPEIELKGKLKKISDQKGIDLWHISITHSLNHSLAFVVAEKVFIDKRE